MYKFVLALSVLALSACGGSTEDTRDQLSDSERAAVEERVASFSETATEAAAAPAAAAAAPADGTGDQVADAGANPGQAKYATCMACHGANGEGGIGPMLQGKDAEYITQRLTAYKAGEEVGAQSALMWGQAAALSEGDIADLAGYISGL